MVGAIQPELDSTVDTATRRLITQFQL